MTVKRIPGASGLAIWIDVQHNSSHFFPIGAIGLGIKKSPIRHEMPFIIACEHRIIRSRVGDIGIEGWFLHQTHIYNAKNATPWFGRNPDLRPRWDPDLLSNLGREIGNQIGRVHRVVVEDSMLADE